MTDLRCDVMQAAGMGHDFLRCINEGTHEYVWEGCPCKDKDPDVCFEGGWGSSWECDGTHVFGEWNEKEGHAGS
jgi:hypothetical protein